MPEANKTVATARTIFFISILLESYIEPQRAARTAFMRPFFHDLSGETDRPLSFRIRGRQAVQRTVVLGSFVRCWQLLRGVAFARTWEVAWYQPPQEWNFALNAAGMRRARFGNAIPSHFQIWQTGRLLGGRRDQFCLVGGGRGPWQSA
jgi:hypothetical protein